MRLVDQHRTQTILALFQVGTILVGSIGIGAILKAMGFSDIQEMSWLVIFVRNWGFILVLIPVVWVLMTIWMELHQSWYSKRLTLVSGLLLLGSLVWFFILVAARASSVLIRMGNQ
jgi:hypothetical protein